jgi:thymidylate synthase ThyX
MTIEAKIIADSISEQGVRLTTFQLRYPRFIHAELMTHRVFSRNASSSRAIPVKKMIEDLRRDPAMPVYWGSNKAGMQAGEELSEELIEEAEGYWLNAMETAIDYVISLELLGLHKQIANRILEPWAHINVVVTATDYQNFYTLRRHADAQPEIKALADAMWDAQENSMPRLLKHGEWHLPYVTLKDFHSCPEDISKENHLKLLKKVSVARCARVSYLTHDGRQTSVEEDIALFEKLVVAQPLHASPAEHQGTPMYCNGSFHTTSGEDMYVYKDEHLGGNFTGWIQYRKTLDGEFIPG